MERTPTCKGKRTCLYSGGQAKQNNRCYVVKGAKKFGLVMEHTATFGLSLTRKVMQEAENTAEQSHTQTMVEIDTPSLLGGTQQDLPITSTSHVMFIYLYL